jgi:nucleoside 2-deoxyribosyltransferase
MNIYIAAHDKGIANCLAKELCLCGHSITSTWHNGNFLSTEKYDEKTRKAKAARDEMEVTNADAVVLVSSDEIVTGGKFVEAGIAIGQGKEVYVYGRRENMLMWHPRVLQYESIRDLLDAMQSRS